MDRDKVEKLLKTIEAAQMSLITILLCLIAFGLVAAGVLLLWRLF